MNIRKATINDLDLLVKVRIDYLTEAGEMLSETESKNLIDQMRLYFERHLIDDTFIAIIAEEEGAIAAVAFLAISEMPASPLFPLGKIGTMLNVLTYAEYRRKGVATQVVEKILFEARSQNIKTVRLFATKDGEPLYRKLGFVDSKQPAMTITLTPPTD